MVTIEEANQAVEEFDLLLYFDRVNAQARARIAEVLVAMCNMPRNDKRERNGHGEQIPYIEPAERLRRFTGILTTRTAAWPGLSQMIALFNNFYVPADPRYAMPEGSCEIPGFRAEDYESGTDALASEREQAQKYIPAPDDEPIGDLVLEIAKVAEMKRLR